MRKNRVYEIFLMVIFFFLFVIRVDANVIDNVNMDIYIDKNGNATVTEVWDVSFDEGSDVCKSYSNMGGMKITNLNVSDDTREYDNISNWNRKSSFSKMSYKSGVVESGDEINLCFGITNYDNKQYVIKYNIENFVSQYNDRQGIYVYLIDMEYEVNKFDIKIHTDDNFSLDTARIWRYGYYGLVEFVDGAIVYSNNDVVPSNETLGVLVGLKKDLFTGLNYIDKNFYTIHDEAMVKMDEVSDDTKNGLGGTTFKLIVAIEVFFLVIVLVLICIVYKKRLTRSS